MKLEVDGLARHFGGVKAVEDLSFRLHEGEILGLIGPNGAGKTTAFNVVTGLFAPTRGRIRYRGQDIAGMRTSAIARHGLARTFQQSAVYPKATVRENAMRGAHARQRPGLLADLFHTSAAAAQEAQRRQHVDRLLEMLSLHTLADTLAGSLSYGNQRRLGVAIALASEPTVLLLDEPVAGLNPEESAEFGRLIRGIVDAQKLTVMLVEHHMRLVMGLCDRIVVLDHGVKIAEGTPTEIQNNDAVIAAYLGVADE